MSAKPSSGKNPRWLAQVANKIMPGGADSSLKRLRGTEIKYTFADPADPLLFTTVGHWNVGDFYVRCSKTKRDRRGVISRCGLLAYYFDWEIVAGKLPATCLVCRGEMPAGHRVMMKPEEVSTYWENPMSVTVGRVFTEKSNLKGKAALDDWNDYGYHLLADVIRLTSLGPFFGWRVTVRDCHEAPVKKGKTTVRIQRIEPSQKFLTVKVHPKESVYTFDCDVGVVRTDVPFPEVADSVQKAVEAYTSGRRPGDPPASAPAPAPVPLPVPAAAPVPSAPVPSASAPINIEQLTHIRSNLDALLLVGKDVNDCAALRAAAELKIESLRTREQAAARELADAKTAADDAKTAARAAKEKAEELERRARDASAHCAELAAAAELAAESVTAAEAVHRPLTEELGKASQELAEIAALEADRLRSLGQAKELLPLLQALRLLNSAPGAVQTPEQK